MRRIFLAALGVLLLGATAAPPYSIQAIRLADSRGDAVAEMVIGAPKDEKIDTVYALWLIRGGGHNILFDSGFHRARWFKELVIKDFLSPDEAVRLAGVKPEEVTDVVNSHAHWDHMGGIDPEDAVELVRLNTEGRLRLIDGDNVEILPGICAYMGGRHTFASQYLRVDGSPPFVLASDNVYLYRNLTEHRPSATFSEADYPANLANQQRMILLAGGSMERVIPGHYALQFQKYPTAGRIANIR
ncbi:MAG TPA: MBL fold metallo-hydrolase [Steroidobacteraceae bacterium]|nr:MBL fold metallo-hydrolase [Steroidobacteraceae bacterium]